RRQERDALSPLLRRRQELRLLPQWAAIAEGLRRNELRPDSPDHGAAAQDLRAKAADHLQVFCAHPAPVPCSSATRRPSFFVAFLPAGSSARCSSGKWRRRKTAARRI